MSKTTTLKAMVIVRGNNAGAVRGSLHVEKNRSKLTEYEALDKNMHLNALGALVHTMETLVEAQEEQAVNVQIFTNSCVMNAIGRLKSVENVLSKAGRDAEEIIDVYAKGKTTGEMTEEEIDLWIRFMEAREELGSSVKLLHMYSKDRIEQWSKQLKKGEEKDRTRKAFKQAYMTLNTKVDTAMPEPHEYVEQEVVEDEALPI